MKSTIAAFFLSLLLSVAFTPVVRKLALLAGATDEAGGRRIHTGRIPRMGGVAVAVAFFAGLSAVLWWEGSLLGSELFDTGHVFGLLSGGCIVLLLGVADDLVGVNAITKLGVQALAATVACWGGYEINAVALPFVGEIHFGIFAIPVTVVWFITVINALNLIDGLDGLAAGIAFFACITNIMVGSVNESLVVVLLSAALGGSLMGFLIYNFNPASIFMGDSGSMFLGFVLAASSLLGYTFKSSTTVAILVPIIALGVPITDTVWAFARRVRERRSIFSADRGHIHHILLDLGLSQRRAVIILYAISLTLTILATGLALGRSLAAGGALIIMAMMMVGAVRTSRMFTLRSHAIRPKPLLPLVEGLRVHVPRMLRELKSPIEVAQLSALLTDFARSSGLPGCSLRLSPSLNASGHVVVEPDGNALPTRRLEYDLKDLDAPARITFWLRESSKDEQAHVLLQLVADGVEQSLKRAAQRERERASSVHSAEPTVDPAHALAHHSNV